LTIIGRLSKVFKVAFGKRDKIISAKTPGIFRLGRDGGVLVVTYCAETN
jgi:hypothetical protein